jgi:glutamate/aspartate transport system permease protein
MLGQFDFNVIERSWVYLFKEGMTFTLTLTGLAVAGGVIFGTLLAMMRLSKFRWLSAIAGAYVNLMRWLEKRVAIPGFIGPQVAEGAH